MAKARSVNGAVEGGILERIALSDLLLDSANARFGSEKGTRKEQSDILDHIVSTFGVDDVLSSLAVNGYFDAEPLVGRRARNSSKITIIEGNRRLAACLILAGDPRAARQETKAAYARRMWGASGSPSINNVPVIVYGESANKKALLSYLGVRHIAASQPWDSYAKAAWIAEVVGDGNLKLKDVAEMIGDQHRTIHRMLQGYYFSNQLIEKGKFQPENSLRKGRGSVTEYPFSWIYTILGYSAARDFVGIADDSNDPKPNPVPAKRLEKAALIVRVMFGDRSKGRNAAIEDSRELGDLAAAMADPVKVGYLEQGKSLKDILRLTKSIDARLNEGLVEVREILRELVSSMSEQKIEKQLAVSMKPLADGNLSLMSSVVEHLVKSAK
ncbi:MAG: hypothetical protein ACT4O6_17370 [Reyranella sp.]